MGSAPLEDPTAEAPIADVVEQHQSVGTDDDADDALPDDRSGAGDGEAPGWDADEADVSEQRREVPIDEDDWR